MSDDRQDAKRLTKNCAQCLICGDVIESKHRHDWVQCSCEAIFVDGGTDYRRMGGNPAYLIDMCKYEKTLVPDSLAVSQENLHSVDKSTVSHRQDRTENGTGVTGGTLQNESQEAEMQGNPLEAVIQESYHLPECQLATGVYDDRADCICDELRACEERVLGLRLDDLNVKSFNAALRDAVEAVKLSCSADIELVERTEVIAVIEALKEKP